jgi:hypothetical protein
MFSLRACVCWTSLQHVKSCRTPAVAVLASVGDVSPSSHLRLALSPPRLPIRRLSTEPHRVWSALPLVYSTHSFARPRHLVLAALIRRSASPPAVIRDWQSAATRQEMLSSTSVTRQKPAAYRLLRFSFHLLGTPLSGLRAHVLWLALDVSRD